MNKHTDGSTIETIAYDCFWFRQCSIKEALDNAGIDITDSKALKEMRKWVYDKAEMWVEFYGSLDDLIDDEGEN